MKPLTAEDLKRLLSTRAVARALHITPRRVQQLAGERSLGLRIGRTLALTVEEVLDLAVRRKPGRPKKEQSDD